MPETSFRISFADGPAKAAELSSSLHAWMNDTVLRDLPAGEESPVQMIAEPANPDAQSDPSDWRILIIEGMTVGAIIGGGHFIGEKSFRMLGGLVAQQLLKWWERAGKPTLVLTTDSGKRQVLDSTTDNAEGAVAAVVGCGEDSSAH
jgi:hypothetical protein